MEKTYYCRCGKSYHPEGPAPGFNDMCDACDAYLHACVNCKLFDLRNSNCTDPAAEPVRTPDGKNYCAQFIPFDAPLDKAPADKAADAARDKLRKLFGNG